MAERHLRPVHDEFAFEDNDEPKVIIERYPDGIDRNKPNWTHPASDSKGHNVQINVKVPPDWVPRLAHIANDKEYHPLRSTQDVMRAFAFFGMVWYERWRENDPVLTELVEVLNLIERTRNAQSELETRAQMVTDAANHIIASGKLKDMEALAKAISRGQEVQAKAKVDTRELDDAIRDGLRELE